MRCKVVRSPKTQKPFLSLPTAFRHGVTLPVIEYEDVTKWKEKAKLMLKEFRKLVGDEYFFYGKTLREKK